MLNLVVNKLTPAPHPKSRAAFIREYENSVSTLKYLPDSATKDWYTNLIKLQLEQEKTTKPRSQRYACHQRKRSLVPQVVVKERLTRPLTPPRQLRNLLKAVLEPLPLLATCTNGSSWLEGLGTRQGRQPF